MDNAFLIRVIRTTVDSWQNLDEKHKGPDFQKSVDRLNMWIETLEKKRQ